MKKSIMYVINNLGFGGAQKVQVFLANKSIRFFDSVQIVSLFKDDQVFTIDEKIELKFFKNKPKKRYLFSKIILYFKIIIKLRSEIKLNKPDIAVVFSSEEVFLVKIASIFLKLKIVGSERYNPLGLPKYKKMLNRLFFRFANHLIIQVPDLEQFYRRDNITVIPNPYYSENEITPCSIQRFDKIVAISARFEYRKGIDILLKAFHIFQKTHSSFELDIYGDGTLIEEYRKIINELAITNVNFYPAQINIIDLVKCAKLFVLPSREEGMPNILIEALASGMPSIASNCPPGGPKYLSSNNTKLLLYETENFQELAEKMTIVVDNKEVSKYLSSNAIEIRNELDPNRIYEQWLDVFMDLIGDKNEK